jgi:hypothetical protein
MVEGMPCTILYDGRTKNYNVKCNSSGKKYIQFNGRILHEDELPFGEEVEI